MLVLNQILNQTYSDEERKKKLIPLLKNSIIGNDAAFESPFGWRAVVYCDYFASGRSLRFIEDYISQQVLPYYANTHNENNVTGRTTNQFRETSRDIVRKIVNGDDPRCCVIFTGSGSTSAVNLLVKIFRLGDLQYWKERQAKCPVTEYKVCEIPTTDEKKPQWFTNTFLGMFCFKHGATTLVSEIGNDSVDKRSRPIVFVSIQEHHSNILPWRERTVADVVLIESNREGLIDLGHLESQLVRYAHRQFKIGAFTAGSNVTGILNDTVAIAKLLHKHNALAVFDYAGVGSYVKIDMNPEDNDGYKDAVFISPHKMIGGPSTPGILVIQKKTLEFFCCENYVPANLGGGIVDFVGTERQVYIKNMEQREEAGTPAIIEAIRCGIVFAVKDAIGYPLIMDLQKDLCELGLRKLLSCPEIKVLGNTECFRIPCFCFVVNTMTKDGQKKALHHNFVASLLNDLFGIQTRGGCMCAAIYSSRLLDISEDDMAPVSSLEPCSCEHEVCSHHEALFTICKPGFVRFSLNYFTDLDEANFILDSIIWVAKNGHLLLGLYDFDCFTSKWFHKETPPQEKLIIGAEISKTKDQVNPPNFKACFNFADNLINNMLPCHEPNSGEQKLLEEMALNEAMKKKRWFAISQDFK